MVWGWQGGSRGGVGGSGGCAAEAEQGGAGPHPQELSKGLPQWSFLPLAGGGGGAVAGVSLIRSPQAPAGSLTSTPLGVGRPCSGLSS